MSGISEAALNGTYGIFFALGPGGSPVTSGAGSTPTGALAALSLQDASLDAPSLVLVTAVAAFVMLGIALFTAVLNRRLKAQRARLQELEALNRSVVETAPDAIVTMSSDGVIRTFNGSAECMFGYAAEEVIGQRLVMLMPERFREPHEKMT